MKTALLIFVAACSVFAAQATAEECLNYPPLVGSVGTPGTAFAIRVNDFHAYVADGAGGLQVLDISTPIAPQIVGYVGLSHDATNIHVAGNFAYVTASDSLHVIDVSTPTNPHVVGSVGLPHTANGVDVSGGYAYVAADWLGGLQIVDVTTPSDPQVVGSYDTYGKARDVAVVDGFAYVADYGDCLAVIDVSTPTAPVHVNQLYFGGLDSADKITVAGNFAYVCSGYSNTLLVIDISARSAPVEVGSLPTPDNTSDAVVVGDFAYVASGAVHVVDISDRWTPRIAGSVKTGDATGVAVRGDYCYAACGNDGVQVHLISSPPPSPFLDRFSVDEEAQGIDIAGPYCYIADSGAGLKIVDVSNPSNLVMVGSVESSVYLSEVSVSGEYAYVASKYIGLQVADISAPTNPQFVGTADTPGQAWDVAVAGGYAYVADDVSGLQVIDVQSPTSPEIIGTVDTPGNAYGVEVDASKGYAFVADWTSLQIIDIQSPANPQIVASATMTQALDVALFEDHAYVACNAWGLSVVDVSTPTSPGQVATVDPASWSAKRVYVADDRAYVAWTGWGTFVFDVTAPLDPQTLGFFSTAAYTWDVAVIGGYTFVSGGRDGLAAVETPCLMPTGVTSRRAGCLVSLLPSFPNPFNPRTTIRFNLQEESPVTVTVFDVMGRRIARLLNPDVPLDPGSHEISWDGTNDRGQPVASGAYFYKLETRWGRTTGRMILVK